MTLAITLAAIVGLLLLGTPLIIAMAGGVALTPRWAAPGCCSTRSRSPTG